MCAGIARCSTIRDFETSYKSFTSGEGSLSIHSRSSVPSESYIPARNVSSVANDDCQSSIDMKISLRRRASNQRMKRPSEEVISKSAVPRATLERPVPVHEI